MQRQVDAWIGQFEEGYWPPLVMMAVLTEEVGELAREVNHRFGSKPKKAGEDETLLALELGDVLCVLVAFANAQGIDLARAFQQALQKYRDRDRERWTPRQD